MILQKFYFFILLVLSIFFKPTPVFAVPHTFTFQTKIFLPDGTHLESNAVNFRFTTVDPTGTCILYVEDFASQNMANSSGLIIFSLGSGSKIYPAVAYNYTDIFNNLQSSFNCQGSGTYSPGAAHTDTRKILLQFNDGSGSGWQTLPAIDTSSVPFASFAGDSEKLGGIPMGNFLQTSAFQPCGANTVLTYNGIVFSCVTAGVGGTSNISTSGNIVTTGSGTVSSAGQLSASSGVVSTSPTTGALVVTGGAGISGVLNVGGTVTSTGAMSSYGNITATTNTAATAGTNQNSTSLLLSSNYWNGSASAVDQWSVQNILGAGTNPTSTMQFGHAGSTGAAQYAFMNGNVGIGNTAPSGALDVQTSTSQSGQHITIKVSQNKMLDRTKNLLENEITN